METLVTDVVIIRPISDSWEGEKYKRSITVPHGPLTLSAHLVDKGFSVEILDEIALEPGETERRLENSLKNKNPLCIGITSMTGEQIKRGKNFASLARKFNPNIPIVWGGAHPTILPKMTLEDQHVDIVCNGEGDVSFPLLVTEMKKNGTGDFSKVPGIYYTDKDGQIKQNPPPPLYDMNLMPDIPYELINMEKYITSIKKKYITRYFEINTSRGCPFKCTFCSNSKEGAPYTKMDAKRIVKEIVTLKKKYDVDGLTFNDENFLMNKRRFEAIAKAIIAKDLKLHIRSGGRIELFLKFDDDFLKLIKKAGFYHFGLGIESGSDTTLKSINKQITVKQIYKIVKSMKKHNFQATYNFIAGFPYETIAEYKKTLSLIYWMFTQSKHVVYPIPTPSFFCPLPGTIGYDQAVLLGHKPPKKFTDWSNIDYNLEQMPWLAKDFHSFIVESRDVINNINMLYTGDDAVITESDLAPLKKLIN